MTATPRPASHPARAPGLRRRLSQWWLARQPAADRHRLTHRNVYILPTGAGWMLALTVAVLLLASINYQLSLGYALSFLLAASAVASMHMGHANLRELTLNFIAPTAVFSGTASTFHVEITNPTGRARYGLTLGLAQEPARHAVTLDAGPQASVRCALRWTPTLRGLHPVPPLRMQSSFPLGTFRVWTLWRCASPVCVYPQPEAQAPALPWGGGDGRAAPAAGHAHPSEFDGVRAYRAGDPLKRVIWKKAAKTGELVSHDDAPAPGQTLWLSPQATRLGAREAQLSRLCAWVLQADRLGLRYALTLDAQTLGPDVGAAHCARCLRALALA
ncbi:MAG: DUF58 domain-containing protein [Rhodoferax sp.]